MFVDYMKAVQQAISSPAAFRPRAHTATSYTPSIEKGRPILQGLLAIDFLAKEVLGWAQAMPKFSGDIITYMQTFLERTYERCRTSCMEENLIRDDNKLILLASLSDSLEYVADSIERLGKSSSSACNQVEENGRQKPLHHTRTNSAPPKDLATFAEEYRKLAIDCLKVLRMEMKLGTIFLMQEMTNREYMDDQDAEEPDDFIISLISHFPDNT